LKWAEKTQEQWKEFLKIIPNQLPPRGGVQYVAYNVGMNGFSEEFANYCCERL
jgi:hypothetical protein